MSSAKSPFGDALMCPVCFFEFDGRILQCSQGHAVCEKCSVKLTECPHCRSPYFGTRNYVLEEVVAKLRGLVFEKVKKDEKTTGASGGSDDDDDGKTAAKTTKEAPDNADQPVAIEPLLSGLLRIDSNDMLPTFDVETYLESVLVYPKPIQAKGSFICRMLKCGISLPICRINNHIRYHHPTQYLESNYVHPTRFTHEFFGLPIKPYRFAIKIKSLGLFFFILNVKTGPSRPKTSDLHSWIQCVCPNNDARNYRFELKMRLRNQQLFYEDMVYGAQSDAAYIEEKEQCLHANFPHTNNETIDMKLEIFRNTGPKNMPRNSIITLTFLHDRPATVPTPTPTVPNTNARAGTTNNPGRRRRRNH